MSRGDPKALSNQKHQPGANLRDLAPRREQIADLWLQALGFSTQAAASIRSVFRN